MAQGVGLLNTAPQPIPGGYGNPAGANIGLPTTPPGSGIPGSAGPLPTTLTPTSGKDLPLSFFPANTGGAPMPGASTGTAIPGVVGTGGMGGLSSGFSTGDPGRTQDLYNWLGKAYGKGPGQLLGNMITKGLFNPQVAQAILNAMEPTIQRGFQDVLGAFGSEGARFSSAASIGAGDYMSQARLGQEAQLAQIYQQDVGMQLNLLEQVLPQIQKERANSGGLFNSILGGIGAIAGLIPGIGPAISSITGLFTHGSGSGGGGGGGTTMPWTGGSVGGVSNPALNAPQYMPITTPDFLSILQSSSAGESLGMPSSTSSPAWTGGIPL